MLKKLLAEIVSSEVSQNGPRKMLGPKKVPNFFFDADFGGFAGILQVWSKLQKFIILGSLMDSFEILGKALTVFEILEKGHFAP